MNAGVVRFRPTQLIYRFDGPSASADPPKSSCQIASYPQCEHALRLFATNEAASVEKEARSCFQTVSRVNNRSIEPLSGWGNYEIGLILKPLQGMGSGFMFEIRF
jgi:hypothetical protein